MPPEATPKATPDRNARHFRQQMKIVPLIFFLLNCVFTYGQKSPYRPFKMVIIIPDTAVIHNELEYYVDTVQTAYVRRFYKSITYMEDVLNFYNSRDGRNKDTEERKKLLVEKLKAAKAMEPEIKKSKYFELIPTYSAEVLQLYFNEYPPHSIFQVVRRRDLHSEDLGQVSSQFKADYVVKYDNIHSVQEGDQINMRLTTTLYSKKKSNILWKKETGGEMRSDGDMWTCTDPLTCLLITCVKSSFEEIFQTVSGLQSR